MSIGPKRVEETSRPGRPHAVNRAIADLRCGEFVLIDHDADAALVHAAEASSGASMARARALAGADAIMAVTRRRAAALDLAADIPEQAEAVELRLPVDLPLTLVNELADPTIVRRSAGLEIPAMAAAEGGIAEAAIELAKLSRLLPAMLLHPLPAREARSLARHAGIIELTTQQVVEHRTTLARGIRRVVDAHVPLADVEDARIIAFRPDDGGTDHLAIVIGQPKPGTPVLARIHSECFTGDLLGSLRCDCGEQLRGAIRTIAAAGGGILVYLAQEGRGIGLVNKLRAYRLQDAGHDTVDANEQLGFAADERVYQPAAEIFRQLGFGQIRLMTNNPEKVAALAKHGVAVERVPHIFTANDHNRRYLETKANRSGHLF